MMRKYYLCQYRLEKEVACFVWFGNEKDGVLLSADGRVACFKSLAMLRLFLRGQDITLEDDDPAFYDFDVLEEWLRKEPTSSFDHDASLNIWNLFTDVAASVNGQFESNDEATRRVYDKVFWGDYPAPFHAIGYEYDPEWYTDDLALLHKTLKAGLMLFKSSINLSA